jgi:hypothetical protein
MQLITDLLEDRHPSTQQVAQWFSFDHLGGAARVTSIRFHELAVRLLVDLPDSPELTVALRKLLEAKDAAVRCAVAKQRDEMGVSS